MIERSRIRIPAGAAGELSSPGSAFCADAYFGIRSTPILPQQHVKDLGHCAKGAGGSSNCKHWLTTSFLQPLPYLVTEICQLTRSFYFIGDQTVVSLLQTTQIISDVCFITGHVAYASSDSKTKIV